MTSLASHQPAATAPPGGLTVAEVAETGGGPRRHLQGCYADLDGLASALAGAGRADGGLA